MTIPPGKVDPNLIRRIRNEIAEAQDWQLLEIVAAVDKIQERGSVDVLISGARKRLSVLQPPRRLRFARLLFNTLNPIIVPASRWRQDQPRLPRSAVVPISNVVLAAMGTAAAPLKTEIANRTTADTAFIRGAGTKIWPAASKALLGAAVPDQWRETGMSEPLFKTIASQVAALLSQAAEFEALCELCASGTTEPDGNEVRAILNGVGAVNEQAMPMLFSLFMLRLPEAVLIMERAYNAANSAAVAIAFGQAAETVIEEIETDGPDTWIDRGSPADAGSAARRLATLLGNLQRTNIRPARKAVCMKLTARLDTACRNRFEASLLSDLLTPLKAMQAAPAPVAVAAMEATARGLRMLELQARKIGSAGVYDSLLASAADTLKSGGGAQMLDPVDRARLVEILTTPDSACEMLSLQP